MSDVAIKVENLHKLYRLGIKNDDNDTMVSTMLSWLRAPKRNYDRLRKLTTFDLNTTDDDVLHALKDVSFEVKHGEVLGIIGRNGAGKSTLLKVLSRITEPSAGRVTINGRVASLLEVGTGFHPELTGRENVYMNGTILGMSKKEIDRKFDEIVDFSGVEKFLDTPVKRYSSGMKVRLAFSVAAHLEPEILIVDEVLAVGDSEFQKKCLGKMQEVSRGGRTIIFVSHQLQAVANLCNKGIFLVDGAIKCLGTSEYVLKEYMDELCLYAKTTPIKDRQDRTGLARLTFEDAWVEDVNGHKTTNVKTGDFIKIVAKCRVKDGVVLKKIDIATPLSNERYGSFTDVKNSIAGFDFVDIKGTIFVKCVIPRLPLNVGQYFFNLFCESELGVEDWIKEAGMLNVEAGDYFGTGKLPDRNRTFLIDHSWEIDSQG